MANVAELAGIRPPTPKNFSKIVAPVAAADPSLLYGVELEIENTQMGEWVVGGMNGKEDGSLRNNGYEYITQPMTLSNLDHCLSLFFTRSKVNEGNYSERCSTHVHANCCDLTVGQLSVILLLYQVFEKLLFRFIGHDRDKNIFCVPWSETTLNYGIVNTLNGDGLVNVRKWQKYTAVNLLPLLNLGTIEFRHMEGTPDKDRIINWCNLIGCLFHYARNNSLDDVKKEIVALNTNSFYRAFTNRVFREWFDHLAIPGYEADLEDGVLQMKYSLVEKPKNASKTLGEMNQAFIRNWQRDLVAAVGEAPVMMNEQPRLRGVRPAVVFDDPLGFEPVRTVAGEQAGTPVPRNFWNEVRLQNDLRDAEALANPNGVAPRRPRNTTGRG